jgi:hypothetical protein
MMGMKRSVIGADRRGPPGQALAKLPILILSSWDRVKPIANIQNPHRTQVTGSSGRARSGVLIFEGGTLDV